METFKLLVINPGSTSTKIAIYENEKETFKTTIDHPADELEKYPTVMDQYKMRKDNIVEFLEKEGIDINALSAVVGRGGLLPPVHSGAYKVNEAMIERLKKKPVAEHASNLGAAIANEIAHSVGVEAYIYDSVAVDELEEHTRVSGMPEIERASLIHALNMRAAAIKTCEKDGVVYKDTNLIVAHLGGGISLSVHSGGKMIDIVSDDEGPFSPERAGRVPCRALIQMCYSGEYDKQTMNKKLRGKGGLVAYLGTVDAREVETRIESGDKEAEKIYYAMATQIAKGIGELATVVDGDVYKIVITGGIAYSKMMTEWIVKKVKFIAPVEILAGENELESLALGVLRVLRHEEEAYTYTDAEF